MTDILWKEVRFDKYCETCKHSLVHDEVMNNPDAGYFDGDTWSGNETREEYIPCCFCLEEAAREGTDIPVEWESKD